MTFLFFNAKKQLQRVAGGKKATLKCSACKATATFYECSIDEKFQAYWVLDLWKKTKRVMQCGECLAVCDYYQIFPQEKQAEEAAAKKAQQEQEAVKKEAETATRKGREEEAAKKYEEERQRKEADVLDELAELKKRINKEN